MLRMRSAPDLRLRLLTSVLVFALLITVGTGGYMLIERWSFFDALYMTVTTVTTVGYREVRPLDTEGRIFTIFLVLFGVGTAIYLLTTIVAIVIEGDLGAAFGVTRMKSRIEHLSDHAILCGYGRVGEEIAREFVERGVDFVIVEQNPETVQRAVDSGYLLIQGDATIDGILIEAGVKRARTLLAASDSDSGNTYITLTAKALNPSIFVVARAGRRDSDALVRRAMRRPRHLAVRAERAAHGAVVHTAEHRRLHGHALGRPQFGPDSGGDRGDDGLGAARAVHPARA